MIPAWGSDDNPNNIGTFTNTKWFVLNNLGNNSLVSGWIDASHINLIFHNYSFE